MTRQVSALVVGESRLDLLVALRQRHPGLDAVERPALAACALEAFGVRNAPACDHPVHLPRPDCLLDAGGVPVGDLAGNEIRDCSEPDVWMRPHVGIAADSLRQFDSPHVIAEDEGTDHTPLCEMQHPTHVE